MPHPAVPFSPADEARHEASRGRAPAAVWTRGARIAAALHLSGLTAAGACREASGPQTQPAATLVLRGLATTEGDVSNPDRSSTATRYTHTCVYNIDAEVAGPAGARARWIGARWTITAPAGFIGDVFRYTGTLTAAEVATAFGAAAVTPAAPVRAAFSTHVTFAAGQEPRGGVGAHHARWEVDYESAGRTQTAAYDVDCTPRMVDYLVRLQDVRTGRVAPFATVAVGGRTWPGDETGVVRPRLALGEYAMALLTPRYEAQTIRLPAGGPTAPVSVVRRAPEVEPGGFDASGSFAGSCGPTGLDCVARVTVYNPAGAAGLPDRLSEGDRGGRAGEPSPPAETLDAYRRRYIFTPGTSGPYGGVLFGVVNADGVRTRVVCESLLGAMTCREADPTTTR